MHHAEGLAVNPLQTLGAPGLGQHAVGVAVALGCGLLIGLERERRKGQGDNRQAAGLRSFAVASLSGALAQASGQPLLVAAGALLVVLLSAAAYFKSRSRDPGLTTELALFTTYMVGVTAVLAPALGAACGAGLALLLAARARLHRFATRLISERELHDGLLIAALALVALPLMPSQPLPWLGGISLQPLAGMVLLILVLQAAGHVALRLLGPGRGLVLAGFFSGFVSSTATIASMGSRARRDGRPGGIATPAAAAVFSTAATWVQAMVMAAALSPAAARALAPMAVAGLSAALLAGAAIMAVARRSAPAGAPAAGDTRKGSALQVREALFAAALLSVVTLAVTRAQHNFGNAGVLASMALAGLADAHAPVASLSALFAGGSLGQRELLLGVLLAVTANSATRLVTAFVAGGAVFGMLVGAALLCGGAAAWTAGLLTA